jgi:hypothetical protein
LNSADEKRESQIEAQMRDVNRELGFLGLPELSSTTPSIERNLEETEELSAERDSYKS